MKKIIIYEVQVTLACIRTVAWSVALAYIRLRCYNLFTAYQHFFSTPPKNIQ